MFTRSTITNDHRFHGPRQPMHILMPCVYYWKIARMLTRSTATVKPPCSILRHRVRSNNPASFELADKFGQTPLSLAISKGHTKIVCLLEQKATEFQSISSIPKAIIPPWIADKTNTDIPGSNPTFLDETWQRTYDNATNTDYLRFCTTWYLISFRYGRHTQWEKTVRFLSGLERKYNAGSPGR
jgi:hypothetical protein